MKSLFFFLLFCLDGGLATRARLFEKRTEQVIGAQLYSHVHLYNVIARMARTYCICRDLIFLKRLKFTSSVQVRNIIYRDRKTCILTYRQPNKIFDATYIRTACLGRNVNRIKCRAFW